mmetsp:Transcript_21474/g.54032  ORF Transcript_21474/g.54032 Transcript_21474/m.54032 type:complete len:99 (-) Transcript_21474:2992-3288(-)
MTRTNKLLQLQAQLAFGRIGFFLYFLSSCKKRSGRSTATNTVRSRTVDNSHTAPRERTLAAHEWFCTTLRSAALRLSVSGEKGSPISSSRKKVATYCE